MRLSISNSGFDSRTDRHLKGEYMDKETVTHYKLILAHDLITFLTNLYLRNVPLEHKAKTANNILEAWEKRVSKMLEESMNPVIKATAIEQDMEEDVQSILIDIFRMEPELLRKEFKVETRHSIFRSFMEENK